VGADAGVSAGDVETAGVGAGVGEVAGVDVETVEVADAGAETVEVADAGAETVEVAGAGVAAGVGAVAGVGAGVGVSAGVGVGAGAVVGAVDGLAEFEGEGKVVHVTITVSALFVPRKGETPRTTWTWIMLALIPCFSRNPATFSARRNARAAEVPGPLA
jgi:hypothetical protein